MHNDSFLSALRRPLTGDEIKSVQAQVQAHHIGGPIDNNFRQHVQMLNDGSPLFDLLRLGYENLVFVHLTEFNIHIQIATR